MVRHLRAEPTSHVMRYRRGRLVAEGPGLAFWFRPITPPSPRSRSTTASCRFSSSPQRGLPARDRPGRDHVSRRRPRAARRPDRLHRRPRVGRWRAEPLEQVGGLLTQLAQQFVIDQLAAPELRAILTEGVAPIRARIAAGLAEEPALQELGLQLVAVRVAEVAPTTEVEKALQQPTREEIQSRADEATFARRATAVENERAIAENELHNRIELARRDEQLVAQQGANERRRVEEEAAPASSRPRRARRRLEADRPTRSTSSRRPTCAPRASGPRSRRRCPPTVLLRPRAAGARRPARQHRAPLDHARPRRPAAAAAHPRAA